MGQSTNKAIDAAAKIQRSQVLKDHADFVAAFCKPTILMERVTQPKLGRVPTVAVSTTTRSISVGADCSGMEAPI